MKTSLARRLEEGGYDGYAYSYPHKTAYRPLDPPMPLDEAWRGEDRRHLHLYVHLPFCEMRCGFCNLFTTVQPGGGLVASTLASIERQSTVVADCVGAEGIAQLAFGGGTPSFLDETEIDRLFDFLGRHWPVSWGQIPASFEVSPGTVTRPKLALLRERGVDRVSLGVQSFEPEDLVGLKRPQPSGGLERACGLIREGGFAVFNIDLIYGVEGQDSRRWQRSLDRALEWRPEELYLYPLYIGRLTNLDRSGRRPADHRRMLYLQGRDFLLASGYRQISMRLFRRADVVRRSEYCCQDDGMVGLGPGARSYTRSLHYSTEYAVGQPGVRAIIEDFNSCSSTDFARSNYGAILDAEEQARRFIIKSLLRSDGLALGSYRERFGREVMVDFPELTELAPLGLAAEEGGVLRLTAEGLSHSDTIGPWLYSEAATARMNSYEFA